MLRRQTLNHGEIDINIDTEVIYESTDGMKTIIPYSEQWSRVFVQTSGGLDSSLLLYLTTKTFKELGSHCDIIPVSMEIPTKAKNLASARAVIEKIKQLTGSSRLRPGLEFHIPDSQSKNPQKDAFFNRTIVGLFENFDGSFDFNGNTKNPPQDVRHQFRDDDNRQLGRDNRQTIYNSRLSASPHAMNNKKGIVFLYNKEGILDELASLTLSCDMDLEEVRRRNLSIPCGECWWCRERAWGFEANSVVDQSLSNTKKI